MPGAGAPQRSTSTTTPRATADIGRVATTAPTTRPVTTTRPRKRGVEREHEAERRRAVRHRIGRVIAERAAHHREQRRGTRDRLDELGSEASSAIVRASRYVATTSAAAMAGPTTIGAPIPKPSASSSG